MKRFSISPPVAALLLAVILFLLSGLLPNGFGSDLDVARAQALNILRLSVFLGVIAAGQTLVIISGSEGIDLSAGAVVTLTAILTYIVVNGANERVLPALLMVHFLKRQKRLTAKVLLLLRVRLCHLSRSMPCSRPDSKWDIRLQIFPSERLSVRYQLVARI